jgi:lysine decarboxylase
MSSTAPLATQSDAPYLDALTRYAFRGSLRFHVPGHKGSGADPALCRALGDSALLLDVPQDIDGIDLGPGPSALQQAEHLAADAYGAADCWFLTNGASQGNHALCLALAPLGARAVVQRNVHASVIDGLVLSGGDATFVAPEFDAELQIAHGVTPDAVARALAAAGSYARAVFIVSPTYYGVAADVGAIAEIAHRAGVPLVVDCAWGAHFGFHTAVPPSPLTCGADAVLVSTHKTVGSLTQSAMLLVSDSGRVASGAVTRAVSLVRSTSPSSLLMASLDAARRRLAIQGEALLELTIQAAHVARDAIDEIPGCHVIDASRVPPSHGTLLDPLRIAIDIRGTGITGFELARALRAQADIHLELCTQTTLVLVLGVAQPLDPLRAFPRALAHTLDQLATRPGEEVALAAARVGWRAFVPLPAPSVTSTTGAALRSAALGPSEPLATLDAVGRISAESIATYPPGIPALLAGEPVTAEVVRYLQSMHQSGARLHGAADPSLTTLRTVA